MLHANGDRASIDGGLEIRADVAVIGGGPAGCIAAAIARQQAPQQNIVIVERRSGPAPTRGQVLLPLGARAFHEAGLWDRVRPSLAPFRTATFRWGLAGSAWTYDHEPVEAAVEAPGGDWCSAARVERGAFDDALLAGVQEMGVRVMRGVPVVDAHTEGDRVERLLLGGGSSIVARRYVDASGQPGVLAGPLGIGSDRATGMDQRMVSGVFDAVGDVGGLGEGPQVRSLPEGWMFWFSLPAGRVCAGVVAPVAAIDSSGLAPEAFARRAIVQAPEPFRLVGAADPIGGWRVDDASPRSARRVAGENWMLCGGAAGVSDPILMAELTIACESGRAAGCTLAALDTGAHEAAWLRSGYDSACREQLALHARFSRAWHGGPLGAEQDGTGEDAWRSVVEGGLSPMEPLLPMVGAFGLAGARAMLGVLGTGQADARLDVHRLNVVKPNLVGAQQGWLCAYQNLGVRRVPCYRREGHVLPLAGVYERLLAVLKHHTVVADVLAELCQSEQADQAGPIRAGERARAVEGLEAMLLGGWLIGRMDGRRAASGWPAEVPCPVRPVAADDRTSQPAQDTARRAIG